MHSLRASIGLAALVAWAGLGGRAMADVVFSGGGGAGTTDGSGPGLTLFSTPASPDFMGTVVGGDTSGGLVDAVGVLVAESSLEMSGQVSARGADSSSLTFDVFGEARWLDPLNYTGGIGSSFLLDFAITIDVTDPAGAGVLFTIASFGELAGITSIRRESDGVVFPSGSILSAATYILIPRGGINTGVSANPAEPLESITGALEATFVVIPLPGAVVGAGAGLAALGIGVFGQRRRV